MGIMNVPCAATVHDKTNATRSVARVTPASRRGESAKRAQSTRALLMKTLEQVDHAEHGGDGEPSRRARLGAR
eukprot:6054054-Pleurochrysis_carterae.AAC.2